MVLPITGPQSTSLITDIYHYGYPYGDIRLGDKVTSSYRQKRPYTLPLPYLSQTRATPKVCIDFVHLQSQDFSYSAADTQAFDFRGTSPPMWSDWFSNQLAAVRNRASAKLQSKLSDTSSALTALVESRETLGMIEKRLVNLLEFKKFFEKKRFKSALLTVLNAQSFKKHSKERQRKRRIKALMGKPKSYWKTKTLSQGWIETWFGWLPTIGDVQKGLEVLSRDLPMEYIKGKTALPHELVLRQTGFYSSHTGKTWCVCGALVVVSNPNLFLASQLGLTNPIYTAFEVLPYSWLLSWFNNLDQFFKQWSVFHGVSVEAPYTTIGMKDFVNFTFVGYPPGEGYAVSFQRSLGLPEVTLQWKGLTRLSATRGATLASLLALRLPKK